MRTFCALGLLTGVLTGQAPDPILARLPSDTTNVFVVRDPVPVVERLLASPAIGKLLADTEQLQRTFAGRTFDAPSLQRQLGLLAPMVPVEIVVAAPTATMDRLSHAASLFTCCSVLQVLARAKVTAESALGSIRTTAHDHLKRLGDLPLLVSVRARDERTAEGWFDMLAKAVPERAKELGLDAKVAGERIELHGEPLAKDAVLRRVLEAAGIAMDGAPVIAVDAAIEQRGPVIELRIGKLAPPPCEPAQLGSAWQGNEGALLFARTEVGENLAQTAGAYAAFAELGDADLGEADTRAMMQLAEMLQRVDAITVDQTVALRVEQGLVWEREVRHDVPPAAGEADVPPELAQLLRPEDGPFAVGCDTLDAFVIGLIDSYLPAGDDRPYSFATMMRTQWEETIEFFDGEDSAVFVPGWLVLTRAATLPAAGERPARPIAGVALVAPLATDGTAADFMAELDGHVAEGAGVEEPLWREKDLGLGVTTHALDLDKLAPSLRPFVHAEAFAPHWFETAGLLVFSTDPSLSKELIARSRGDVRPLPHARLASWAQVRGDHLHAALTALAKWPEVGDVVANAAAAAAAALAHVELVESMSWVDGNVQRERTSLRLREPAPK